MRTVKLFILFACFLGQGNALVAQDGDCGLLPIIVSEDKPVDWMYPEVLVLVDSFSGPELDPNLWGFGFPWGRMLNEEALEGMALENLSFEQGQAIIKTEYRPRNFERFLFNDQGQFVGTEPVPKDYSSAGIFSRIEFTRGRFELDYEIDPLSAQWPAFWLYGDCQQEIDIFEYFYGGSIFHDNWTKEITYTIHQDYDCSTPEKCRLIKTKYLDEDFYDSPLFNGVVWDRHQLKFYRSEQEFDWIQYRWRDFSYRPLAYPQQGDLIYQSAYFPFDQPMQILIGQGVHKNIDEKMKEGPKFLKLNHVEVWQKAQPSGKLKIDKNYHFNAEYDGIIRGAEINLSDATCFMYKDYLIVRALNDINLDAGFDSGNHFVDLKALTQDEIRYPEVSESQYLTPQKIIAIRYFDFQGQPIGSSIDLNEPLHRRDQLIYEDFLSQQLKGMLIAVIEYSDHSTTSIKLSFL